MAVSRFVFSVIVCVTLVTIVSSVFSGETRQQEKLSGRVVSVIGGDTLILWSEGHRVRIRLASIDAPERGQEFAKESRSHLVDVGYKKDCEVAVHGREKNETVVGEVKVGDLDLASEMLKTGWAWYVRPEEDGMLDDDLAALEDKARLEKLGIWAEPEPVAPWEWRRLSRSERSGLVTSKRPPLTVDRRVNEEASGSHWLNTSSGVRHNKSCEWYNKTRQGRSCSASEGKPCGLCGG